MEAKDEHMVVNFGDYNYFLRKTRLDLFIMVAVLACLYFVIKIYTKIKQQLHLHKHEVEKMSRHKDHHKEMTKSESIARSSNILEEASSRVPVTDHPVYRICLTGGPCAGKTTSLATLMTYLQDKGFRVFVVPEAATLMNKGGCFINSGEMNFRQAVRFQMNLMKIQMHLENVFVDLAINSESPSVVIMDRGAMDGSAYVEDKIWKAILNESGWTTIQLRDQRYDAICHLVTAADGAEEFYGKNNEARYESLEQARATDLRLINAYTGHPQHKIFGNSHKDGFKGKIDSLLSFVKSIVGLPQDALEQKKYLIESNENGDFMFDPPPNVKMESFEVEETYLIAQDADTLEHKVRSRGKGDSYTYAHEVLKKIKGEKIKRKRPISAREYIQLLEHTDPDRKSMAKARHCFIYENNSYIIDVFQNLDSNTFKSVLEEAKDIEVDSLLKGKMTILRVDVDSKNNEPKLPPFVKVVKDVTDDVKFKTYELSKMKE